MSIETFTFTAADGVPNNPALPVVLIRGAFDGADGEAIRDRIEANGWGGTWIWTVFDYHHFHPNAHEALVATAGEADLALGGPEGSTVAIARGDCIILPAGTGHKLLRSSEDFRVCGAYPPGQEDFETLRRGAAGGNVADRIAAVARPSTDPTTGGAGPLLDAWS